MLNNPMYLIIPCIKTHELYIYIERERKRTWLERAIGKGAPLSRGRESEREREHKKERERERA